jgi:alpha-D-ribose 1-methylphosphonate 5-triphosphate synthase subunit PhnH
MSAPAMSQAEVRQHAAFTAMMWALSYPGRPQRLPVGGLAAFTLIGETLVDLETGFFTPDVAIAATLAHTGGRALPPSLAPYQLYPRVDEPELASIRLAPAGTYLDPDVGATLVLGCTLGEGPALTLVGPGIARALTLRVGGLPDALWRLRAAAAYPLGWDILLVAGDQLVGLPRTTAVEVR